MKKIFISIFSTLLVLTGFAQNIHQRGGGTATDTCLEVGFTRKANIISAPNKTAKFVTLTDARGVEMKITVDSFATGGGTPTWQQTLTAGGKTTTDSIGVKALNINGNYSNGIPAAIYLESDRVNTTQRAVIQSGDTSQTGPAKYSEGRIAFAVGSNPDFEIYAGENNTLHILNIDDSIVLNSTPGFYRIMNTLNSTSQNRLMGLVSSTGQVGNVTIGSGLSLSSGVLSSSGGTPGGSDTYIQFNDGGSFGGDAGFTYNKTTNVFSTNNGAYRPTGTISFSDAGAGSVYKSSSDGLVLRAVTGSGYDLLMYDAVGNGVFGIEAGTSKLGSTSQIGAGLLGYGSWNAWMNLRGGTTTNASLTIRDGVAPSSPAEGQIWRTTDKVYNVIQTGAATKEFTLNDIALTTGRIPYTTTNGRLTDTATFLRSPGGSVGIGTTSPTASALLDVSSTTKGALMPRMTTTQRDAISSPATGLELFNTTTNSKQIYDGTRWVEAAHPLYKVYTALLTQSGTSAPTATVLENTLGGTVVWSYNSAGDYTATLSGAFTSNKTWLMCNAGQTTDTYAGNFVIAELNLIDVNSVRVITSTGGSGADDELLNTSIEIRVYY